MANVPDILRVAVIAAATQTQAILELERLLIDHGKVQLVRFETAEPFLEYMQDLTSLPPHFALIETGPEQQGLGCLEQLRSLETGQTLSTVMLANEWTARMLERASQYHAASCILVPNDPVVRFEVFTALVTYWCSINEPAN
jgi:hypothetical protein